jgi:menaquinone-dependent protoporphyrinogen oxidase
MTILVAYASKYGATQQIAERIAATLTESGLEAEPHAMKSVTDVTTYDAFVLGSAIYFGHWLREGVAFVERNRHAFASHPVWLFSSGPLGTPNADTRAAVDPNQITALLESLKPRDHRVFFGALDHTRFGFRDRLIRALPAGKKLLVDGDFRDWNDVERWAKDIAVSLARALA